MRIFLLVFLLSCSCFACCKVSLITPFEQGNGNQTATYDKVIDFYQRLADQYDSVAIETVGMTDAGLPLHVVTLRPDSLLKADSSKYDLLTVLINNGIHPGEPDGIDATMMLFRDYVQDKISAPQNTILVTIPIYNVGGALNRNSTTRTNQNGPQSYGFRGNARNYDLNRDFIKADTLNARAFMQVFHRTDPDVFIDNHVSNGADYQYVLTHLMTQHNKLGGQLGRYLHNDFQPKLEKTLSENDWPITPYVNVFNKPPETGFSQFFDSPRYSTGYTTLFNTLGMMVETHMLKPYMQRVEATYQFLLTTIKQADVESQKIKNLRNNALQLYKVGDDYPLQWQLAEDEFTTIDFLGYEAQSLKSEITDLKRLKYNRNKPFKKKVAYHDIYQPSLTVTIPKAYVIPQGWHEVIKLLKRNQIEMRQFKKITELKVESYRIESYSTQGQIYEGHYLHDKISISKTQKSMSFPVGDYYIPTDQKGVRYLLEVLEPEAMDSFFRWNFFDTILAQKEGFSPYVWEDKALDMLKNDAVLKRQFEAKRSSDKDFAENAYDQLQWLHHHSENYEQAHLRYPVYRVLR